MAQECDHHWQSPGAIHAPTDGGVLIILPLYCTRCAELRTKIAPPPEQPQQSKIARAQLVPSAQLQRR